MPDAYCPMRACLIGGCAVAFGTTTVGALLGGGFGVPGQMRMAWHGMYVTFGKDLFVRGEVRRRGGAGFASFVGCCGVCEVR